jgi:hypothetical protein
MSAGRLDVSASKAMTVLIGADNAPYPKLIPPSPAPEPPRPVASTKIVCNGGFGSHHQKAIKVRKSGRANYHDKYRRFWRPSRP